MLTGIIFTIVGIWMAIQIHINKCLNQRIKHLEECLGSEDEDVE